MGFIEVVPEGMMTAAATTTALSAEAAGHTAQAGAVAAVEPPGLEEISAANVARIAEYASNVAAVLGGASAVQAAYGAALGSSGAILDLGDALAQLSFASIV